ncbi:hypothetical protein BGW38_007532, partial [Lunasporangiospora selenospora]
MASNTMNFGPEWMRRFPVKPGPTQPELVGRTISPSPAVASSIATSTSVNAAPDTSSSSSQDWSQPAPAVATPTTPMPAFSYSSVAANNVRQANGQSSASSGGDASLLDIGGGHGGVGGSSGNSNGTDFLNPFKYSKELMLSLYKPTGLPIEFERHEYVTSDECLLPLAVQPLSEQEVKLLAGSVNSDVPRRVDKVEAPQERVLIQRRESLTTSITSSLEHSAARYDRSDRPLSYGRNYESKYHGSGSRARNLNSSSDNRPHVFVKRTDQADRDRERERDREQRERERERERDRDRERERGRVKEQERETEEENLWNSPVGNSVGSFDANGVFRIGSEGEPLQPLAELEESTPEEPILEEWEDAAAAAAEDNDSPAVKASSEQTSPIEVATFQESIDKEAESSSVISPSFPSQPQDLQENGKDISFSFTTALLSGRALGANPIRPDAEFMPSHPPALSTSSTQVLSSASAPTPILASFPPSVPTLPQTPTLSFPPAPAPVSIAAPTISSAPSSATEEAEEVGLNLQSEPVELSRWLYRDPSGSVQGPFMSEEMHEWYMVGFFSLDLYVKREQDPGFEPLGALIRRTGSDEKPFIIAGRVRQEPPLPMEQSLHPSAPPLTQNRRNIGQNIGQINQPTSSPAGWMGMSAPSTPVNPKFGVDRLLMQQQQQGQQHASGDLFSSTNLLGQQRPGFVPAQEINGSLPSFGNNWGSGLFERPPPPPPQVMEQTMGWPGEPFSRAPMGAMPGVHAPHGGSHLMDLQQRRHNQELERQQALQILHQESQMQSIMHRQQFMAAQRQFGNDPHALASLLAQQQDQQRQLHMRPYLQDIQPQQPLQPHSLPMNEPPYVGVPHDGPNGLLLHQEQLSELQSIQQMPPPPFIEQHSGGGEPELLALRLETLVLKSTEPLDNNGSTTTILSSGQVLNGHDMDIEYRQETVVESMTTPIIAVATTAIFDGIIQPTEDAMEPQLAKQVKDLNQLEHITAIETVEDKSHEAVDNFGTDKVGVSETKVTNVTMEVRPTTIQPFVEETAFLGSNATVVDGDSTPAKGLSPPVSQGKEKKKAKKETSAEKSMNQQSTIVETSNGAIESDSTKNASSAPAWSTSSASSKKKTLREIQLEEEAAVQKTKVVSSSGSSGASPSGLAGIVASGTGSVGRRYADSIGPKTMVSTGTPGAWGSGPLSASAGSRPASLGRSSSAFSGAMASSGLALSGSTTASRASTTSTTFTSSNSVNNSNGSNSKMGQVSEPRPPSEDFLRWCRQALKGIQQGVVLEDFIQMLLTFPLNPDPQTVEIIQDSIYASSQSLDGRRFADEFIKRRKADAAATASMGVVGGASSTQVGG